MRSGRYASLVRVVTSDPAVTAIREHGGRLFVWMRKGRCCGAARTLATSYEPPAEREFRRVEGTAGYELFLPSSLGRLPDELQIDLRRFPRRVEAFWDGCVWVV